MYLCVRCFWCREVCGLAIASPHTSLHWKFQHVTLARNCTCSLMMICDVQSKHVGEVKVF